jgi:hypothetical protein
MIKCQIRSLAISIAKKLPVLIKLSIESCIELSIISKVIVILDTIVVIIELYELVKGFESLR